MPQNEFFWEKGELPQGAVSSDTQSAEARGAVPTGFRFEDRYTFNNNDFTYEGSSQRRTPFLNNSFLSDNTDENPYFDNRELTFYLERADQDSLRTNESLDTNPFLIREAINTDNYNWKVTPEDKLPNMKRFALDNSNLSSNRVLNPKSDYTFSYRDANELTERADISEESEEEITSWKFITAPGGIEWDKESNIQRVNTYGSNNPFQIVSGTSLRRLSLNNCLVEGYTENKIVEDHILTLEKLLEVKINLDKGYASPYVWKFIGGEKVYGYFLISKVAIKEKIRNSQGQSLRSKVDIELVEVPKFQINDGRDLASKEIKVDKNLSKDIPKVEEGELGVESKEKFKDNPVITSFNEDVTFDNSEQFRFTTSGEAFDRESLTAAHTDLPLGSQVRVTNTENGESSVVTINDRVDRGIRLTGRVARILGIRDPGIGSVLTEVIRL